jgi:hypothetical protein
MSAQIPTIMMFKNGEKIDSVVGSNIMQLKVRVPPLLSSRSRCYTLG